MPDLGKAYVQIVPSAEGISGSISNLLGGEVESAGQQAGESLGSKLMGVAKKVIAAAGITLKVSQASPLAPIHLPAARTPLSVSGSSER